MNNGKLHVGPGLQRQQPWPRTAVAWYVVLLLCIAYAVSFVDRYLMALLVGPIKQDLGISDTEIGLLQGIAFGVIYAVVGLPIGKLVDTADRHLILSAGVFIWSSMTALCGLASTIWLLALGRMGIGIGEATLTPCALSLIPDYFPPERRNRAFSAFMMGSTIGSGSALIVGGAVIGLVGASPSFQLPFLGMLKPWQLAFVVVGLPGIVLSFLMVTTVREPLRRESATGNPGEAAPLADLLVFLVSRRGALACQLGGMSVVTIGSYAYGAWIPTFFIRIYGWTPQMVGGRYGPLSMVFGCLGLLASGALADALTKRGNVAAPILVAAIGIIFCAFPGVVATQAGTSQSALSLLAAFSFFHAWPFGLSVAALMAITPNQLRGQVSALYIFTISVVGFGVGPVAVGVLNDYFYHDPMAIRNSISIVEALTMPTAGILLLLGLKPFIRARRLALAWEPPSQINCDKSMLEIQGSHLATNTSIQEIKKSK